MITISNKFFSIIVVSFIILSIIGYQLATTALIPLVPDAEGASRLVTVPYRAIILALTVLILLCTPKKSIYFKTGRTLKLLIIFWLFYAIRIAFDIYVRGIETGERSSSHTSISIFIFLIAIPTFLASMKAFKYVNINKLNKAMLFSMIVYLGVSLMNNSALMNAEAAENGRISGNAALNTISFGHACLTCAIFLYCYMRSYKMPIFYKNVLTATVVLALFFMFLAGSRGPVVTFVVIVGLYLIGKQKNKGVAIILVLFFCLMIYAFYMQLLHIIGEFAPTFEQRMLKTILENNTGGRDLLYQNAIELFLRNPIIGSRFLTEYGIYAHNMILDAFMGLGFLGGAALLFMCGKAFLITSKMLQQKSMYSCVGLLCVQQIMLNMLSGCFYTNGTLSLLMVAVFYYEKNSMLMDNNEQNY